MSHSKNALGADDQGADRRRKIGLGSRTGKFVVAKRLCGRGQTYFMIMTKKGRSSSLLRKSFKIIGDIFKPARNSQESLEERMQKANKA